jgi:hypothetical protein
VKSTHHYSKKEEEIIELFMNLGVSKSFAQDLIDVSNLKDENHRMLHRRLMVVHTEEDEDDIESYYLYDTILYPPSLTKPYDTINQ